MEIQDNVHARVRLGLIYMDRHQPRRALAELERALALSRGAGRIPPLEARVLFNLGAVHYNYGGFVPELDWQRSIEYWEQARRIDPRLPRVAQQLQQARERLRRERGSAREGEPGG